MKKIISIILLVSFVLCLVACGGDTAQVSKNKKSSNSLDTGFDYGKLEKDEYAGQFRVGYSATSITPVDPALPLSGYGNEAYRIGRGYLDEIQTKAIAVSDKNNNTLILIQIDVINIYRTDVTNTIYTQISKITGVPQDHIIYNCSHTHSGPAIGSTQMAAIQVYTPFMTNNIIANAVKAMNDRKPASMYYGDTQISGHNFVRHYDATDGEGDFRVVGDNHWDVWYSDLKSPNKHYIGHAATIDHTFHMIKFARKDADDVCWMSFRAHNTITGNSYQYLMSADWTGRLCSYMEEENPGTKFVYFQGDAGNVNVSSRIEEEEEYVSSGKDSLDGLNSYVHTMMDYVTPLFGNLKEVPTGLVGGKRFTLTWKVNHALDNLQSKAALVTAFFKKSNDTTETKRYAYTLGLVSQYQASAITSKAARGADMKVDATVMVISGIGMTFAPGEMFNQLGVQVKERSPFDTTISFSYSSQAIGYIPDSKAYDYGCYETDTCPQAQGSGEMLVDAFIENLNELKKTVK